MFYATRCLRLLVCGAMMLAAGTARGQARMRFATPIAEDPAAAAQFSGTVGDAPPFDPYSDPSQARYPVARQGTAGPQFGVIPEASFPDVGGAVNNGLRFLQSVGTEYSWITKNDMGVSELEFWATFAVPSFFYNNAPLLITPGFNLYLWDGPSIGTPMAGLADLPPQTYDSYIDAAWQPQVTPWMAADLGLRIGVHTDFDTLNHSSVRFQGRAFAVFQARPDLVVRVGVLYLDRLAAKILPAGGVIWTPHADARYEIVFPNPRLAHRWFTTARADYWVYVAGEYGGGSWTITRAFAPFPEDEIDYSDIRISLGVERSAAAGAVKGPRSWIEVAYVLDRELQYRSGSPGSFKPDDTLMLRAGLRY